MHPSSLLPADSHDQAARWYARLQAADCSATEREAFEQWCIEDPSHIDSWLAVCEVHERAAELRDDDAVGAALRVARRGSARPHRWQGWQVGIGLGIAALLVLAIILVGWRYRGEPAPPLRYATAVGEQRAVVLADGTSLLLDTDSTVLASIDDARRELTVERGRVNIAVAEDAARGFEVLAGRGRIRDIGTEFQVAHGSDGVTVTLIEGMVGIRIEHSPDTEAVLAPGEELSYGKDGRMGQRRRADLETIRGWTHGQIILKNRPLDELLTELNRYSSIPLRLADPSVGKQTISGVFNVDDRESLLRALDAGWGLKASSVSSANEIVLTRTTRR